MPPKDVEIIEKTTPFKGYLQLDHYLLRHELHQGGMSDVMSREIIERGHVGAVLLYDPELDLFVLVEQFRPPAHVVKTSPWWQESDSPWMVECVAGILEENEMPEDLCRRESIEEADCEVTDLEFVLKYFSSPGCLTETVHLFLGRVDASNAGGIHGLKHEHEDIRVFTVSPSKAYEMVSNGRICNAMTLLAIQWFQLNGRALRHKWLGQEA